MPSVDDFIAFVKEQYGITLTAKPSTDGDTFEKLYGDLFGGDTNAARLVPQGRQGPVPGLRSPHMGTEQERERKACL